jgi:hypothetical protein
VNSSRGWLWVSATCAGLLSPGCLDPFPEDPGARKEFSADDGIPLPVNTTPASSGAGGVSTGNEWTSAGAPSAASTTGAGNTAPAGSATNSAVSPVAVAPIASTNGETAEGPADPMSGSVGGDGSDTNEMDAGSDADAAAATEIEFDGGTSNVR